MDHLWQMDSYCGIEYATHLFKQLIFKNLRTIGLTSITCREIMSVFNLVPYMSLQIIHEDMLTHYDNRMLDVILAKMEVRTIDDLLFKIRRQAQIIYQSKNPCDDDIISHKNFIIDYLKMFSIPQKLTEKYVEDLMSIFFTKADLFGEYYRVPLFDSGIMPYDWNCINISGEKVDIMHDKYTYNNSQNPFILGKGRSSVVWRGEMIRPDGTQQPVAIKIFKDGYEENGFRELETLISMNHNNIIKPHGFLVCPFAIILELVTYNDKPLTLSDFINHPKYSTISDDELVEIIFRICSAMEHMGELGIIHADLKPENILMTHNETEDTWNIKVSDFDTSLRCATDFYCLSRSCGTKGYQSPEQILQPKQILDPELLSTNCRITLKSDIWSFGIILMKIFTGINIEQIAINATNKYLHLIDYNAHQSGIYIPKHFFFQDSEHPETDLYTIDCKNQQTSHISHYGEISYDMELCLHQLGDKIRDEIFKDNQPPQRKFNPFVLSIVEHALRSKPDDRISLELIIRGLSSMTNITSVHSSAFINPSMKELKPLIIPRNYDIIRHKNGYEIWLECTETKVMTNHITVNDLYQRLMKYSSPERIPNTDLLKITNNSIITVYEFADLIGPYINTINFIDIFHTIYEKRRSPVGFLPSIDSVDRGEEYAGYNYDRLRLIAKNIKYIANNLGQNKIYVINRTNTLGRTYYTLQLLNNLIQMTDPIFNTIVYTAITKKQQLFYSLCRTVNIVSSKDYKHSFYCWCKNTKKYGKILISIECDTEDLYEIIDMIQDCVKANHVYFMISCNRQIDEPCFAIPNFGSYCVINSSQKIEHESMFNYIIDSYYEEDIISHEQWEELSHIEKLLMTQMCVINIHYTIESLSNILQIDSDIIQMALYKFTARKYLIQTQDRWIMLSYVKNILKHFITDDEIIIRTNRFINYCCDYLTHASRFLSYPTTEIHGYRLFDLEREAMDEFMDIGADAINQPESIMKEMQNIANYCPDLKWLMVNLVNSRMSKTKMYNFFSGLIFSTVCMQEFRLRPYYFGMMYIAKILSMFNNDQMATVVLQDVQDHARANKYMNIVIYGLGDLGFYKQEMEQQMGQKSALGESISKNVLLLEYDRLMKQYGLTSESDRTRVFYPIINIQHDTCLEELKSINETVSEMWCDDIHKKTVEAWLSRIQKKNEDHYRSASFEDMLLELGETSWNEIISKKWISKLSSFDQAMLHYVERQMMLINSDNKYIDHYVTHYVDYCVASGWDLIGDLMEKMNKKTLALACYVRSAFYIRKIFGDFGYYNEDYSNRIASISHTISEFDINSKMTPLEKERLKMTYYEIAYEGHFKCLAIRRTLFGSHHLKVEASLSHISIVLFYLKQYHKALEYTLECYNNRKCNGNKFLSSVAANSCKNLALIHAKLDDGILSKMEQRKYYRKQLNILIRINGFYSVNVAEAMKSVGILEHLCGEHLDSIKYFGRRAAIYKQLKLTTDYIKALRDYGVSRIQQCSVIDECTIKDVMSYFNKGLDILIENNKFDEYDDIFKSVSYFNLKYFPRIHPCYLTHNQKWLDRVIEISVMKHHPTIKRIGIPIPYGISHEEIAISNIDIMNLLYLNAQILSHNECYKESHAVYLQIEQIAERILAPENKMLDEIKSKSVECFYKI